MNAAVTHRVLVVDDDLTVNDVVSRYLRRAGFVVDQAGDGPTALRTAAGGAPDLVVLDLMLPGMSGLEVCRRLRAHSDVPVVMLAALSEDTPAVLVDGSLRVDPVSRLAYRDGSPLALTVREFDLLVHFLRHPGRVFNRADLLQQVWGWSVGDHATVTVHVRRLREKIEEDPKAPTRIVTAWGVGYRYQPGGA